MVSRWVNNHQQPSDFYRDLLARTLGRPRAELFSDEAARLELAAEAEPWLLARALEASSVGQAALEALEQAVWGVRPLLPEHGPDRLARPVLEHFRDVPFSARPHRPAPAAPPGGAAGGGRRAPGRAGRQPRVRPAL